MVKGDRYKEMPYQNFLEVQLVSLDNMTHNKKKKSDHIKAIGKRLLGVKN